MAALKHITVRFVVARHYATALYVPGHKAQGTVSILSPCLDHIDTLLEDVDTLERNFKARDYNVDVEAFRKSWNSMKDLNHTRKVLEEERVKVSDQMKTLSSVARKNEEQVKLMDALKKEGKVLREKLKELNQVYGSVEETALTQALSLPNITHANTPSECTITYFSEGRSVSKYPVESHIDIALKKNWLKYDPPEYYLRDRLALWELKVSQFVASSLKKSGFNYMAAPDFAKSVIVDGCGYDFAHPQAVFTMKAAQDYGNAESGNALHLVGGASLPAFAAFYAKNVIESPLPLRFCGIGRQYAPSEANFGLFSAAQATCVQFLSCVEDDPQVLWSELLRTRDALQKLMSQFDIPFRTVAMSPRKLSKWEQYRSSLQVYSPFLKEYVEVGHTSIVGDYISRRLAVYVPSNKHPGFVTGTALNVAKFLACFLENRQGEDGSIGNVTLLDC